MSLILFEPQNFGNRVVKIRDLESTKSFPPEEEAAYLK